MTEVVPKRQIEGMTRHPHRKHSPHGQPYTRISRIAVPNVEATPDGPEVTTVYKHQITGYTFETKFDGKLEEWVPVVEEHDLGQADTLEVAHTVAADWRGDLVGNYSID